MEKQVDNLTDDALNRKEPMNPQVQCSLFDLQEHQRFVKIYDWETPL